MNKILYNGQVIIDLDELADKYTKAEVDALVSSVFKYKGTVATKADLNNIADMKIGDCYNVEADGVNYAWNGEEWDALSGTVDLTSYYTKEQVDGKFGSYLSKNNTTEYTPTADYHPATKKYVDTSIDDFKHNFLNNMQFKNTSDFLTGAGEFNYVLLQETFPQGGFLFNESYITIAGVNIQANSIMQVSLWYNQIVITLSSLGEMLQFIVTENSCIAFRFIGTEVTLQ